MSGEEDLGSNKPLSGYDFPPFGLNNGKLVPMHANALSCITLSFICAIFVLIVQFRTRKAPFYTWTTSERLVVYQAICDAILNVVHFLDHAHMVIVRYHVTPPIVCKTYGALLGYSMHAQMLMILLISAHAFLVVCFNVKVPFGRRDRYLLAIVYGTPIITIIIGASLDIYGTNTAFCFTDYLKPGAQLAILTIPSASVCILSTLLYVSTWLQIVKKTRAMKGVVSNQRESASTAAAKTMTLFVIAFLAQWHFSVIFGIWSLANPPPPDEAVFLMTTFVNLGGFFNLIVYIVIRRRRQRNLMLGTTKKSQATKTTTFSKSTERSQQNFGSMDTNLNVTAAM